MDIERATEVLRQLADGVDPASGEELPPDGPYQKPHVIRALFVALNALERRGSRQTTARAQPGNAGKPWSDEEDRRLIEAFEADSDLRGLARAHDRSRGAIQARLVKLGKIEALPSVRLRGSSARVEPGPDN